MAGYSDGYDEGLLDGRETVNYKTIALKDHKFTRGICTAWWFGSNAKERKLR